MEVHVGLTLYVCVSRCGGGGGVGGVLSFTMYLQWNLILYRLTNAKIGHSGLKMLTSALFTNKSLKILRYLFFKLKI